VKEPAERESSAHARTAPEAAAAPLRWLSPGAAALAALARVPSPSAWAEVRTDPGALLLLLRHHEADSGRPFPSALLEDPTPLEEALHLLSEAPGTFVDWERADARPVYDAALATAALAQRLAERTGLAGPEQAWCCGLLAPLGRLALCVPGQSSTTPDNGDGGHRPNPVALARRLARRWELPGWLAAVAGHLALPLEQARSFGAETALFRITRLAAHLAAQVGRDLGLTDGTFAAEDAAALRLSLGDVQEQPPPPAPAPVCWQDPREAPLLRDLLAAGAENRRLRHATLVDALERQLDGLHRALEEQRRGEGRRLREGKLEALAEFAAGAGHEINNPLAVISGQAQYLLGHADAWFQADAAAEVRKSLQAVVAQTRRIHGILRDLMLFARPAPPCLGPVDLPTLLGEVASSLADLAAQRRVRVEVAARPERLAVHADAEQVRLALGSLLRNAIEAAPADGWARLVLDAPADGARVEVAVEDSGPGPEPGRREALFDPFYSGRAAGRGRGLGLPIAWRLARQQGGDVRLEPPCPQGPTRFVLTLPRAETPAAPSTGTLPLGPPHGPRAALPANGRHAG
jgi:two-component system, NtrC family, sensor kinase